MRVFSQINNCQQKNKKGAPLLGLAKSIYYHYVNTPAIYRIECLKRGPLCSSLLHLQCVCNQGQLSPNCVFYLLNFFFNIWEKFF